MISESMMENKTNLKFMTNWYEKCQISCPMHPCQYSYCITNGHEDHPGISNSISNNSVSNSLSNSSISNDSVSNSLSKNRHIKCIKYQSTITTIT